MLFDPSKPCNPFNPSNASNAFNLLNLESITELADQGYNPFDDFVAAKKHLESKGYRIGWIPLTVEYAEEFMESEEVDRAN